MLFWIVGFRPSALDDKEQGIFAKRSVYCGVERNGRKEACDPPVFFKAVVNVTETDF